MTSTRLAKFERRCSIRTLSNGMRAIHVPNPDEESFYLEMMIRAGSRLEKEELTGTAHFLEHMMFRGSKNYPEYTALARAFETLGGDWNAATGHEHTEYSYAGIRSNGLQAMRLFHEFLESPRFNDLEVERKVIIRELEGDLNEHGHSLDTGQHIAALLWSGCSLAVPIIGRRESLESLKLDQLTGYRDRHYIPVNMTILAVGGDDTPDVLDSMDELFGAHRNDLKDDQPEPFPALTGFSGPAVHWVENSDNEYAVQVSFRTEGEWSKKIYSYGIISRVLADGFCSRLCNRLRETLGLVYDIEASAGHFLTTGSLDITAAIHPDHVDRFFPELFSILNDLADNGLTDEEMTRTRLRAIVDIDLMTGSPEEFGSSLAWGSLCGEKVSLLDDRVKTIALKAGDIQKICRELFRPTNTAVVILGPEGENLESRILRYIEGGLP